MKKYKDNGNTVNTQEPKNSYIQSTHKVSDHALVTNVQEQEPKRVETVVNRFDRDSKKVNQLKTKYGNKCQVCGYVIQTADGSMHSAVHHLHPLKDGGVDDFGNMLVLCPNHHAEFDYKVIGIKDDKKTVVDFNGDIVGTLTMMNGHTLDTKNIRFHWP